MSGPANTLANAAQKIDPFAKAINLTGDNLRKWPAAMGDPIAGLILQRKGETPLWRAMAKGDPLGNKLGMYGKNAPTPWDPLGRKMKLYGYDVVTDQTDWGSYQYTAEQMQDPNFNYASQNQAKAAAATIDDVKKKKSVRGATSKLLLGE